MLVSIKMILAVFVIALAFRAIAEYQIRIIRVGAAAYRAAMAPALLRRLGRFPHLGVELLFAPDFLRIIFPASCHQEIDQEVQNSQVALDISAKSADEWNKIAQYLVINGKNSPTIGDFEAAVCNGGTATLTPADGGEYIGVQWADDVAAVNGISTITCAAASGD